MSKVKVTKTTSWVLGVSILSIVAVIIIYGIYRTEYKDHESMIDGYTSPKVEPLPDWDSVTNSDEYTELNSSPKSSSPRAISDIDKCVNRGIRYFKEIGSYPTLSSAPNTGRSAEAVAFERCSRTTTSF